MKYLILAIALAAALLIPRAGRVQCPDCHGSGLMPCVFCLGSGHSARYCIEGTDTCFLCHGKGKNACKTCKGSGYIK